jgi:hypothetical protein
MVICPLCEHAQELGPECAVCGSRLAESGAGQPLVERLADLEPTRLELPSSPMVPLPRMEGLEPTQLDAPPIPAAPGEVATWIERTVREPAAAGATESLEVERTAHAPREAPMRDLFVPSLCRYCRTPAAPGDLFCGRCGLKLAVYSVEPATVAGDVWRCRFCGTSASGVTCPACGARVADA